MSLPMCRYMGLWVAALLGASPGVVQAQTRPTLVPGARVRLEWATPAQRTVGTALEVRPDELVFRRNGADSSVTVPWSSVAGLEQSTGKKRNWLVGLGVGAFGGAVLGFGVSSRDHHSYDIDPRPYGAAFGILAGGALGLVIGAASKTDRWQPVPLER